MSSMKVFDGRAVIQFSEQRHTYSLRIPALKIERLWQPSTTGVLGIMDKPALIPWSVGQMRQYAEMKLDSLTEEIISVKDVRDILADAQENWRDLSGAANIGSLAHRYLHAELSYRAGAIAERPTMTVQADPVLAPNFTQEMIDLAGASVTAGLQFLDEHHVEPIMFERMMWSPTHGVVGTADLIAKVDGVLSVLDWKTSSAIFPEYHLQTACYSMMAMEEFGDVIRDRYVVNVKKSGGLEVEKRDLDTYSEDIECFLACRTAYAWKRANDKYRPGSPIQVLGPLDNLVERPKKTS